MRRTTTILLFFLSLSFCFAFVERKLTTDIIIVDNGNGSNSYYFPVGTTGGQIIEAVGSPGIYGYPPGTKIYFQRGGKWILPQQWDVALAGNSSLKCYIGAYASDVGDTAMPLITQVDTLYGWSDPNRWVQYVGTDTVYGSGTTAKGSGGTITSAMNVWKYKTGPSYNYSSGYTPRFILSGSEYRRAHRLDSLNIRNRTFFSTNQGIPQYPYSTLYVYSVGNPASYYAAGGGIKTSWPFRPDIVNQAGTSCINFTSNYTTVENINFQGGDAQCFQLWQSNYDTVRNCQIGGYTSHFGALIFGGAKHIEFYNNAVDSRYRVKDYYYVGLNTTGLAIDDGIQIATGAHYVRVYNCSCDQWGHSGYTIYNLGHNNTVLAMDTIRETVNGVANRALSLSHIRIFNCTGRYDSVSYCRFTGISGWTFFESGATVASLGNASVYATDISFDHNKSLISTEECEIGFRGLNFSYNIVANVRNPRYTASFQGVDWKDQDYDGCGLQFNSANTACQDMIVVGNVFANCDRAGWYFNPDVFTSTTPVQNNLFANNILYNNNRYPKTVANSANGSANNIKRGVNYIYESMVANSGFKNNRFQNNLMYSDIPGSDTFTVWNNKYNAVWTSSSTVTTNGNSLYKSVLQWNADDLNGAYSYQNSQADTIRATLWADPMFVRTDSLNYMLADWTPTNPSVLSGGFVLTTIRPSSPFITDAFLAGNTWPATGTQTTTWAIGPYWLAAGGGGGTTGGGSTGGGPVHLKRIKFQ